VPLIIAFAVPLLLMMKYSGYPMRVYGLTVKNAKESILESLLFSAAFMFAIILYKLFLIHFIDGFEGRNLFDLTLNLNLNFSNESISISLWISVLLIYLVFVPIQELLVRGALQSSFQVFLVGKHKILWSILLSNLIFSASHTHISVSFSLLVFIPGVCWGWLYYRYPTLIGVTLSHLIIGLWAIFIVGIL
jgi:membrane protease YdiL (CAAX protease family)